MYIIRMHIKRKFIQKMTSVIILHLILLKRINRHAHIVYYKFVRNYN